MTSTVLVRPFQPRDESGLLQVWREAMWADPISDATWRAVYLADSNFRRETCPVAVVNDRVVGFVLACAAQREAHPEEAWVISFGVLPECRRRGIATRLFEALTQSLRRQDVGRIVIGPYIPSYITPGVDIEAYPDAMRFLEGWGAQTLSNPISMKASLTGIKPVIDSAASASSSLRLTIREALPSDILPCIEFVRREFSHWVPDVLSVVSRIFGGNARFDTLIVALGDDITIGFAMSRGERFGPFGVQERTRGLGVGGALLSATLMTMRTRGFHCAWFLWTNDRAARLYRAHGFEEVRRFALMAKDVSV